MQIITTSRREKHTTVPNFDVCAHEKQLIVLVYGVLISLKNDKTKRTKRRKEQEIINYGEDYLNGSLHDGLYVLMDTTDVKRTVSTKACIYWKIFFCPNVDLTFKKTWKRF